MRDLDEFEEDDEILVDPQLPTAFSNLETLVHISSWQSTDSRRWYLVEKLLHRLGVFTGVHAGLARREIDGGAHAGSIPRPHPSPANSTNQDIASF